MKSWLGLWVLVVGLVVAPLANAEVVIVPVERANVTETEGEAIAAVFADAYAEVSREPVRRVAPAPKADGAIETYSETARANRAAEYVVVKATRLDKRMVLSATRYAWDGKEIFRARMTAASLDDIEPIAARLSQALFNRQDPERTRSIDTVTERESQKKNSTFVEKVMGLKTSYMYISTLGSDVDLDPTISFGFDGRLEGRSYFLEIGAGFLLPPSSDTRRSIGGLYGEIGGSYYLGSASVSPYVGGGVLPRIIGGDDIATTANLAVYGQAGLMFFRESSTRLYVDARVAQSVTALRTQTEYSYSSDSGVERETPGDSVFPTELGMAVGIGW